MSEPAIAIGGTEVDLKGFGRGIVVPINPQSHLMYYLSCVNTLLTSKGEQTDREMKKLCDYKHFYNLTEAEVDKLILLCFLLSPDVLLNKCVFQCDDLCQDYDNNFFEFSAVSHRFVITRDLLIGGERRAVKKIMACRMCWLEENWIKPMEHYKERLVRITSPGRQQRVAISAGRGRPQGTGNRGASAGQERSNPSPRQEQASDKSSCVIL